MAPRVYLDEVEEGNMPAPAGNRTPILRPSTTVYIKGLKHAARGSVHFKRLPHYHW